MTPAIQASGLARSFGSVVAVASLDLAVAPGELYGLVGPDGAGKTTAIRLFSGLLDPTAGEVRLLGIDPRSRAAREHVGVMPQRHALYGDLSVDENLAFFADLFDVPRKEYADRRARLLGLTRLLPFGDRRAEALSGGMYKKLALACALLHSPPVLLLDEPTNGVDPVSRRELWALLHELVASGTTVVVTTPYLDEAERCHRVGVLHHGRLLAEGDPAEWARQHGSFEEFFVRSVEAA
jgi:ABC-2 type transport system ATP-binding protein